MSPEFSNNAMIRRHFPQPDAPTREEYDAVHTTEPMEATPVEPEMLFLQNLLINTSSESWRSMASCNGPQRESFFPPEHMERKEDKKRREERAKRICDMCVVSTECLETALDNNESYGIWGGANEVERKELQRRRRFR